MQRVLLLVAAAVAACLATSLNYAAEKKADDTSAIRKTIDSYTDAYNQRDAKTLADHWSEQGEWISPDGERLKGRETIERALEAEFKEQPKSQLEVFDVAIRLLAEDVAVEEGTARVVRGGEAPDDSTYIAIHVKKGGKWKLDSVRETSLPQPPVRETPLNELAWLVGDWIDESPDSTIATSVSWTKNNSFLSASFKLSVPGMDDLDGTQVIGWDADAKTIRSWMFDSDGGIGEGTWSKQDGRWFVKFSQVLADGGRASSTNIYAPADKNSYTWESIGRKVDDQYLPNIEPVRVVRKGSAGPTTTARTEDK